MNIYQSIATITIYSFAVWIAGLAALEDVREGLLRNKHTFAIASLFLLGHLSTFALGGELRIHHLLLGGISYCAPWLVLNLVDPSSVGAGDIKYSMSLGLGIGWIDPGLVVMALQLAAFVAVGALLAIRILDNEHPRAIPFGPHLMLGATLIYGSALIDLMPPALSL